MDVSNLFNTFATKYKLHIVYYNMKKLSSIIFLLLSISCYSQITTITTKEKEEEIQKYDSLESLNYKNARLHLGQTLFIKGNKYEKESGIMGGRFYLSPPEFNSKDYYKPFKDWRGPIGSSYSEIAGRYFEVTNVISRKYIKDDIGYILELIGDDNVPIYIEFRSYSSFDDYVTVGYYEKMKQIFIGKEFYSKGDPINNADTEEIISAPFKTKFKCVGMAVKVGEYGHVFAVLENSKYGKVKGQIATRYNLDYFISVSRYNEYIKKYGTVFGNKVAEGNIKIGMNKNMVRDAWGSPDHINTTRGKYGTHEQWVYGSRYLYFENGKLTSMQI